MAQRSSQKKKKRTSRSPVTPAETISPAALALGAVFALGAIAMSIMLSLEHLGAVALPGCGPGSGCAEVAKSYWGKVPGTSWPTSFAGLAYFLAVLVYWLGSVRGTPAIFRWVIRLGVLGSLWLIGVMFYEDHFCQYCIGAHGSNVAFWIVMEISRRRAPLSGRLVAAAAGVYVVASVTMGVIDYRVWQDAERRGEADLADSTAAIIAATERAQAAAEREAAERAQASGTKPTANPGPQEPAPDPPPDPKPTAAADPPPGTAPVVAAADPADPPDSDPPAVTGFRGRYLYGPEKAAVRLVLFTDYQCRDCRRIEMEIRELLEKYDDISLSVKQFPFDERCNETVGRTLHANACWASCAAETAGIMWGNDGFWAMHHWLFDREGSFRTTKELEDGIRGLGYDPRGFVKLMTGPRPQAPIQEDIKEARECGLWQTPMIFINGVELRGWHAQRAIIRAVEAVRATNPTPQTHAHDRPPLAVQKCVGDWREQRPRFIPFGERRRMLGAENPKATVVVFGDYEESTTAEVDEIMQIWVAGRDDTQYVFRHYPFDQDCNDQVPSTKHENACWAARLAEAAAQLDGNDGFWRMHTWLMNNPDSLTEEAVRAAAAELEFDADALFAAMEDETIDAGIKEDVTAGKAVRLTGIPMILINGRHVARWRWLGAETGREILESVMAEAAGQP